MKQGGVNKYNMKIAGKEISFIPEFGNQLHIKIGTLLGRIDRNTRKLADAKDGKRLIENDLRNDKIEVVKLLRMERQMQKMKKVKEALSQ